MRHEGGEARAVASARWHHRPAGVTILVTLVLAIRAASAQQHSGLKSAADRYWDAFLERYPTRATEMGDHRFNDRLEDVSVEGQVRHQARLRGLLSDIEKISSAQLSSDDRLTYGLLVRAIRDELLGEECLRRYLPLDPLAGYHLRLPLLLVSQPLRTIDDYRAYIARLNAFPKQVDDLIANLREGIALGVVGPGALAEKVIPQLRAQIVDDPTRSEFYKPVLAMDAFAETDREGIRADLVRAIGASVVPGYRKLAEFAELEYLSKCTATVGIGALPGGGQAYENLVYLSATVSMLPREIHELGLAEVARIRGEMEKVRKEVGFGGTLDEFLEHMRTDPKHRFTSREELIAAADAILQRAKSKMPQLFNRLPKADCVMMEIESFRAPSSPVAYYNPTPEDGSRPGFYYINTHKPEERLRFTLEALSYHEAVPGHHFQMALDQENASLPKFRRYGSFTAYVEGWALYTEKLGYEIGGYTDAYSRFGQLTFEMWRACRLVVDTGMHALGWSRQQAIDFMMKNASLARIDVENEIDRYIAWPGQAVAYKIGELRILALRELAERSATPARKFDLRAFHDQLLSGGAMPIDILESRMKEWIAGQ